MNDANISDNEQAWNEWLAAVLLQLGNSTGALMAVRDSVRERGTGDRDTSHLDSIIAGNLSVIQQATGVPPSQVEALAASGGSDAEFAKIRSTLDNRLN